MTENSRPTKLEVAREHLECALDLYYQDKLFSSLHLAGAAEEILGEYLRRAGLVSAWQSWCAEGVEIINQLAGYNAWSRESLERRMKYPKNRTKHMDQSGDEYVLFNEREEAEEFLSRAVSDYYTLMSVHPLSETALIKRFNVKGPKA